MADPTYKAQPGDVAVGKDDAPVTIVAYVSMTCPHCANFEKKTFPQLKERYIDTGKARFVFRPYPLDNIAAAGSMLAYKANESKKGFDMIHALFAKQDDLLKAGNSVEVLKKIAKEVGFDENFVDQTLKDQNLLNEIQAGRKAAASVLQNMVGYVSVPAFSIRGEIYKGDMTIENWEKAIQRATALEKKAASSQVKGAVSFTA
ncbi:MAG: DsbA family protein [Proteobacteria bacterium]|nr:DsbA family protein [Pseudomonadota bacterium]